MFYDVQSEENKGKYKQMLIAIGKLSKLFSDNNCPYLAYRIHENFFCHYLEAENLARADCSADAKKGKIGIGLKTWMGSDDQKIAEFGKLKEKYANMKGLKLVKQIAYYRNERIRVTKNLHNIDKMIYHVVKRMPNKMEIFECAFDMIDIDKIKVLRDKGNQNNTYFTDGKHTYHFSISKNTLYMIFDGMEKLDSVDVAIMENPYDFLYTVIYGSDITHEIAAVTASSLPIYNDNKKRICLPLYSTCKGKKVVCPKSGLNQWNAAGRNRHPNEVYIRYNKSDRNRTIGFFPPKDTTFTLHFPDGKSVSAKLCQEYGKAIMSNPNRFLGKWLLRDVLELKEGTIVTYDMLQIFGIDCVIFTKNAERDYSIDFAKAGTYEKWYDDIDGSGE